MLSAIALWIIFVSAPAIFVVLFFYAAPYGRHFKEGWGPSVSARVGWIVMEAPALLVIGLTIISSGQAVGPVSYLLLGLWEVHYLYRTCLFPFLMKGSEKRFPVILILFAFIFNTLNGYANGSFLSTTTSFDRLGLLGTARLAAGIALFVAGMITHILADSELRNLRKPGETDYKVPRGGLFDYVSSPNYFGEIAEWCGWALATWSLAGLGFALFTIANLAPRAFANRRWYIATFADYPRERKSLIPFVF
jgi:protein-S-isoprenylcysteine O-methyltransferase Ste14